MAASAFVHLTALAMMVVFAEVHPFSSVTAEPIAVDIVASDQVKPEPMPDKTQPSDAPDLPTPSAAPGSTPSAAPPPAAQPPRGRDASADAGGCAAATAGRAGVRSRSATAGRAAIVTAACSTTGLYSGAA